mmetsp:Transcript_8218/g.13335  ORF Transcript_8218/g.13335 Transcript_8218/m.13335 type:complete len:135 (+) Transcript_8218:232-636(+)
MWRGARWRTMAFGASSGWQSLADPWKKVSQRRQQSVYQEAPSRKAKGNKTQLPAPPAPQALTICQWLVVHVLCWSLLLQLELLLLLADAEGAKRKRMRLWTRRLVEWLCTLLMKSKQQYSCPEEHHRKLSGDLC